jgi:PAS domain S-box-containing protein
MELIEAVNILLVDDEPDSARTIQAMLAPLRENVVCVTSADDALKHLSGKGFAVILISTPLLRMDGVELARDIRDRSRSNRTPVVFLGADDDADAERAYAVALVDFLRKPLNPVVVRAKIGIFVELYRRTEELTRLQRQQHTAILQARDSRMKLILENTKDFAFIGTDRNGIIREWAGGAQAITGWSPAEAIGRPLSMIFTEQDQREGRPALERNLAIENRRTDDKRWHLKRDGSLFYADGVMVALHDQDLLLQGFAKIFRDATAERDVAEALASNKARLREQHERGRHATHAGGLGMWTWLPDGSDAMIWENDLPAEMFASTGDALPQTKADFCARYLAFDDAVAFDQAIARAIAEQRPFKLECRFTLPGEGTPRWLTLTGRYYAETAARPAQVLGTIADITDRKR